MTDSAQKAKLKAIASKHGALLVKQVKGDIEARAKQTLAKHPPSKDQVKKYEALAKKMVAKTEVELQRKLQLFAKEYAKKYAKK